MKLATTDRQLAVLAELDDTARDNSATLKVPREALRNLLRDHYEMNSALLRKNGALPETAP